MEKEALFYEKLEDKKVHCLLCPWECVIADGKNGVCGVRKNEGGVLYSLIYGIVSSIALDPIEKKPVHHFKPRTYVMSAGTFGCNMFCGHCQNWRISQERKNLVGNYVSPEKFIEIALMEGAQGVAWTYNEPTIWFEYTLDCAKLAKEKKLYTVYVTNGYINIPPLEMIAPYLDVYRADIKAYKPETYKKLCKINRPEKIFEAVLYAKNKLKLHVEIITNVVPTLNDSDEELSGIARFIHDSLGKDVPWHITRFFPYLDFQHLPPTPIETLEKARKIGLDCGLKHVHIGNV